MNIFEISEGIVKRPQEIGVKNEKELQDLVEKNLKEIFGLELIKSEYDTRHGLVMDTLAFDESTNSPVIIEYKQNKCSSVIDQGFAYMSWMLSHKGDIQKKIETKLGKDVEVDWSQPKLIFVAKDYTYHQICALGIDTIPMELYRYSRFENNLVMDRVGEQITSVNVPQSSKNKINSVARKISQEKTDRNELLNSCDEMGNLIYSKFLDTLPEMPVDNEVWWGNSGFVYKILYKGEKVSLLHCIHLREKGKYHLRGVKQTIQFPIDHIRKKLGDELTEIYVKNLNASAKWSLSVVDKYPITQIDNDFTEADANVIINAIKEIVEEINK
ncbi:hypothetical protein ACFLQI_01590 [Candidatus Undinarchaeota archaeon]